MHYRAISNTVSHLEVFWCERINTAKQKDGLAFHILSVLEAKFFQFIFAAKGYAWYNYLTIYLLLVQNVDFSLIGPETKGT